MRTHQPASRSFLLSLVTVVITAAALLFLLPAPRGRAQVQALFDPATARGNDVTYFNTRTGFRFTTVAAPPPITALGRLVRTGNSGTRQMQIIREGADPFGSQDVVEGSVVVTLNGVSVGDFAWGTLATPFQPAGNTTYLCVSDESSAGSEKEAELIDYTLTGGFATGISARYETTGGTKWAGGSGADDNVYGGVNLKFDTPTAGSEVTSLTATAIRGDEVELTWEESATSEKGFRIERKVSASGPWVEVANVGDNVRQYRDTQVSDGTVFYYRVRPWAQNAPDGTYSAEASVTTPSLGAPVASLSASSLTAILGEPIRFDTTGSTNVAQHVLNLAGADAALPSRKIEFGIPGVSGFQSTTDFAYTPRSSYVFTKPGSYRVRLTVRNAKGQPDSTTVDIAVTDPAFDTVVDMTNPAFAGGAYYIDPANYETQGAANATKLQEALAYAEQHLTDRHRRVIVPLAKFVTAGITFPQRQPGDNFYIRVESAGVLPARGQRVTSADQAQMPRVLIAAGSGNSASAFRVPPVSAEPPHHYILRGLYISRETNTFTTGFLVYTGTGGGTPETAQTDYNKVPHHFLVERSILFGNSGDPQTGGCSHGVQVDSDFLAVTDSKLTGFGDNNTDALPFQGASFRTTQWYENNELEASGELFILGGGADNWLQFKATPSNVTRASARLSPAPDAGHMEPGTLISFTKDGYRGGPWVDTQGNPQPGSLAMTTRVRTYNPANGDVTFEALPAIPDVAPESVIYGQAPGEISFRRNHGYKTPDLYLPNQNDVRYMDKNLFELKTGRNVVIDGNIFHDQKSREQGHAGVFVFTVNNSMFSGPVSVIENIQVTRNRAYNAGAFLVAAGPHEGTGREASNSPSHQLRNIYAENNLATNLGYTYATSGSNVNPQANIAGLYHTGTHRGIVLKNNTIQWLPDNYGNFWEFASVQASRAYDVQLINNNVGYLNSGFFASVLNPATGSAYSNYENDLVLKGQAPSARIEANVFHGGNGPTYDSNGHTRTGNLYLASPAFDLSTFEPTGSALRYALDGGNAGADIAAVNAATLHTVDGDWSGNAQPLFTGVSSNTPVNYFAEAGFKFTTVASPGRVYALGRLVMNNNSGTITLCIRRYDGDMTAGQVVAEATVNLSSAQPGEVAWATLDAPATLLGNTVYLVTSQESNTSNDEAESILYQLTPGFATGIIPQYWTGTNWHQGGGAAGDVYCGVNLKFGP